MNELKVFTNEEFGQVRTVVKNNEPWFVAADVCKALEIGNVSMAISRLDDDEKDRFPIETNGGVQNMSIVSESGLYALILGSRKKEARRFRRWITSEVLPSIRRGDSILQEISERKREMTIIPSPSKIFTQKSVTLEFEQKMGDSPLLKSEFAKRVISAIAETRALCAYQTNDIVLNGRIIETRSGRSKNFNIYKSGEYEKIKEECPPIEYAGYVYVVEYGDYIKIGQSTNPYQRVRQLKMQAENYAPYKLGRIAITIPCSNYEKIEKLLHQFWSEFRKESTELFDIPFDYLVNEIETHKIRLPYRSNISKTAESANTFLGEMKQWMMKGEC